ncbi:ribonuclease III [Candidatus Kaiserbacteria bacterium RIFCSPLOWO2_02_FULL_45_11b]|uniref:Ribonuclease 3 n=1 Tax=Candidatus Kaiserbacteria bacterium RIFCSPLOWO2_12_FULL_45_26 TaxID=1798525 RepID=A0A1F6FHF3_9BACT|nr:MAG: ribonuclease III [Candidatus Kaiserbacteria bacterium RIFCSPHIGHO2_12_45_16]OGG70120.1 MAG: ribonuclease III [Candidatus Kaiserbacteria bacterium RIFCSPLOWO2_01_FULL_45_25]OGG83794.1 MAG: ribonuclease III [Candidatus Kaiserbacteria bacterium RIFCSPLOWO2_02_FULL_45_11b]OGG85290.1 MAG: ribonuclease III [Candidatus Kaiserbacteria bacterium RIFCSPLOWO2_12_FULL_45_26]
MSERNIESDLQMLQEILGVTFADPTILLSAVTHRSYLNEHREATWEHNERLEFLGDAVLELVVTDYLFSKYPEKPEGELTAIRAALVNTNSLAAASEILGVNKYLLMSKGESKDEGRARQYILANVFESCIGAMYLDQGYDSAKKFIADRLFGNTEDIVKQRLWQDAKSRFQELSQEHASITPTYDTLSQDGPDHDRIFTVGVFLRHEKVGEGKGRSKQEAEQQAAQAAIKAKGWDE